MARVGSFASDRSTFLFAVPRSWEGFGRVVDIAGTFDDYNTSQSNTAADVRALTQDWLAVGEDLWRAMQTWDSEHPT